MRMFCLQCQSASIIMILIDVILHMHYAYQHLTMTVFNTLRVQKVQKERIFIL